MSDDNRQPTEGEQEDQDALEAAGLILVARKSELSEDRSKAVWNRAMEDLPVDSRPGWRILWPASLAAAVSAAALVVWIGLDRDRNLPLPDSRLLNAQIQAASKAQTSLKELDQRMEPYRNRVWASMTDCYGEPQ